VIRRIEELRWEDMALVFLRDAKNGLRRNSLDEVEDLFDFINRFPRDQWPAEVARFVDRYKRPRGVRSSREMEDRFYSDPNRVAAALAADIVAAWRDDWALHHPKRHMPHRVKSKRDGTTVTIHNMAISAAVRRVNANWQAAHMDDRKAAGYRVDDHLRRRTAKVDIVKELLRRARTARPARRSKW
jgi:hypothetical protein